ncbi:SpoU rRNA methylase family protein [Dyadobacter jejuensis]|uniref:SpoU rRNA methylase family protein n=1 Tax=Dyadobacter jejuensis TaxID=1082580 RepID=A0A316ATL9_9BACT|nr:RNA methyltransferase [Dyadobacter jejuensis]PWJ60629.1 SpoU rRNA methylase family protein [Dyadobacter jejuensis]
MRKLMVEEMNRLSVEDFIESEKFPFQILLDNIRSLNNVGSFFRTADAFRAEKLVLGGYTPHPPHREITRSALGAENSVAWVKVESLESYVLHLKEKGYQVVAIEQAEGSISLEDFVPMEGVGYAFIFGNEVEGVRDELMALCDACLEIPQFGTKHSLNVSVSAGIILWSYVSKKIN